MDLRRLRYFVAVAEELHFGRAAERLGMSQPPLSEQMRRLETEVGTPLLLRGRGRRRVALTEAGHALLVEARRLLEQADQSIQLARRAGRGEGGALKIGFIGSASCNILPGILGAFRERCPGVALALYERRSDQQLPALRAEQIDVGFLRPPVPDRGLRAELVFSEPLVLALPRTHPLAGRARVSLRQVADEPFMLLPRHLGPSLYDQIVATCRRAGFSPRVGQEAVEMHTLVSLVAAGMGVALMPASFEAFQRAGVVYVTPREPTEQVEMAVAWRRDSQSPVLRQFLAVVREQVRAPREPSRAGAPATARGRRKEWGP